VSGAEAAWILDLVAPFLLSAERRERFTAFVGERAPALLPLFAEE
jgi:hypothetical protein